MTATVTPDLGRIAARPHPSRATRLTPADVLLAAYVASLPIEQLVQLPGVGGSLSRPLGFAAIVLAIVGWSVRPRLSRPRTAHVALVLFVTWSGVTVVWSVDAAATVSRLSTYLPLLAIAIVLNDRLASPRRLQLLLGSFVVGAAAGLADVASRLPAELAAGDGVRVGGTDQDVNEFGVTIAIAIAAALLLTRCALTRRVRRLAWLFVAVAPLFIVLTGSRGALLAMLPSLVLALWWSLRRGAHHLVTWILVVGVMLTVIGAVVPDDTLDRLSWFAAPGEEDASIETRSALLSSGLSLVEERPLRGFGSAAFGPALEADGQVAKAAHSTGISITAELGLVGLTLFSVAVGSAVWSTVRRGGPLCGGWIAFAAAWLIGASTLTWEHTKVTWFVLAMLAAAPSPVTGRRVRV